MIKINQFSLPRTYKLWAMDCNLQVLKARIEGYKLAQQEEIEFLYYTITGTGYTKEYYIKMLEERISKLKEEERKMSQESENHDKEVKDYIRERKEIHDYDSQEQERNLESAKPGSADDTPDTILKSEVLKAIDELTEEDELQVIFKDELLQVIFKDKLLKKLNLDNNKKEVQKR